MMKIGLLNVHGGVVFSLASLKRKKLSTTFQINSEVKSIGNGRKQRRDFEIMYLGEKRKTILSIFFNPNLYRFLNLKFDKIEWEPKNNIFDI